MPPLVLKSFDDLKDFVGREIGITDWFEITQDRILKFAEATKDRQWIHIDSDRAQQKSPYGTTIAHGFLTLSLLSHLSEQALQIQNGIGMVVNYWSSHSADAARAAKTDAALTVIMQQAADMKGSQSRIEGSVQAVTNVAITLQAKVEAQAREISDMKEDIKTHNVFVVKITNDIAKLQAKLEK
jgi:hypothetical protein